MATPRGGKGKGGGKGQPGPPKAPKAPRAKKTEKIPSSSKNSEFDAAVALLSNVMHGKFVKMYLEQANGNATRAAELAGYSPRTAQEQGSRLLKHPLIKRCLELASRDIMPSGEILERQARVARADMGHLVSREPRLVQVPNLKPALEVLGQLETQIDTLEHEADSALSVVYKEALEKALKTLYARKLALKTKLALNPDALELVNVETLRYFPVLDWDKAVENGATVLIKSLEYDKFGQPKIELHDAMAAQERLGKHQGLWTDKLDITSGGETLSKTISVEAEAALRQFMEGIPAP